MNTRILYTITKRAASAKFSGDTFTVRKKSIYKQKINKIDDDDFVKKILRQRRREGKEIKKSHLIYIQTK